MPGWTGIDALVIVKEFGKDVPFIVVSGSLGDEAAADCIKQGATDYVLKDRMARLPAAIQRALQEKATREEKRRAIEARLKSEQEYRLLFEGNPLPMWVYDLETLQFIAVNEAAIAHYGYSNDEFLSMTIKNICPPEIVPALLENAAQTGAGLDRAGTWRHRKKDGSLIDVEITSHPVLFRGRRADLVLAIDITERKRLQDQLRQAQKMEAIGQLAGGVAHDFNNLLTIISGYGELLADSLASGSPDHGHLKEIQKAADRAAGLTRQLLAFGRRQVLEPQVLNLNAVARNMEEMLRRLIGEDINLVVSAQPELGCVKADVGQIEQVIMNLVVNARDAMPQGGRLRLEMMNVNLDEDFARGHFPITAGHFVMLSVSDNGCGIDAETQAHMFEPFFTTKEKGKGTGLGLATAYGIVKQSGGFIWVDSEPERGATFNIYFPRINELPAARELTITAPVAPHGGGTILVVEDEEALKSLVCTALRAKNYTVIEAASGREALLASAGFKGPIHLLITDVVMPRMKGTELAQRLTVLRPQTKVLYISGYTNRAFDELGEFTTGIAFLQKPFTPQSLANKVREILDAPQSSNEIAA